IGALTQFAKTSDIDACLALDARGAIVAAAVAQSLKLPGHPPSAAEVSRNKLLTRERLRDSDLLVPWFFPTSIGADPAALAAMVAFPCVIKLFVPSGGRAVVRADDAASFVNAFDEMRAFLASPELDAEADEDKA